MFHHDSLSQSTAGRGNSKPIVCVHTHKIRPTIKYVSAVTLSVFCATAQNKINLVLLGIVFI